MKRIILFLLLSFPLILFSQKAITYEQAARSTDVTVIAKFVKDNPTHPKSGELKRKMISMMNSEKSPEEQAKIAKPDVKPISTSKLKNEVKKSNSIASSGGPSEQNKKTAALLTHMFNNDPTSKEAYIQIVNQSKCNLIVKISGKKFYNLTVPASGQNFILVDKGKYNFTSSICDAKYSSSKNITQDVAITLSAPVMKKRK